MILKLEGREKVILPKIAKKVNEIITYLEEAEKIKETLQEKQE